MGLSGSWLHHGEEVAGVTSLVAESDRHDHLLVASDGGQVVVPLNPPLSSFEDGPVGMREVPPALSPGIAVGPAGQVAIGHRHVINAAWGIRSLLARRLSPQDRQCLCRLRSFTGGSGSAFCLRHWQRPPVSWLPGLAAVH